MFTLSKKHYHHTNARHNEEHMKTIGSLSGQPKINFPVSDNQIRSCYTQGPFSIVKSLPYYSVLISCKAAFILAKQIINHFLASGLSTKYYRVGCEEDWKDNMTGNYDCAFIRKLHTSMLWIFFIPPTMSLMMSHHTQESFLSDCGLMVLKHTKSRQRIISTISSCLPWLF